MPAARRAIVVRRPVAARPSLEPRRRPRRRAGCRRRPSSSLGGRRSVSSCRWSSSVVVGRRRAVGRRLGRRLGRRSSPVAPVVGCALLGVGDQLDQVGGSLEQPPLDLVVDLGRQHVDPRRRSLGALAAARVAVAARDAASISSRRSSSVARRSAPGSSPPSSEPQPASSDAPTHASRAIRVAAGIAASLDERPDWLRGAHWPDVEPLGRGARAARPPRSPRRPGRCRSRPGGRSPPTRRCRARARRPADRRRAAGRRCPG